MNSQKGLGIASPTPTMHVFKSTSGVKRLHCSLFSGCCFSCPNHVAVKCPNLEFFDIEIPSHSLGMWYATDQVYNVISQHTTSFPFVSLHFYPEISQSNHVYDNEITKTSDFHDQQRIVVWASACDGCKFIQSV
jgi:hypothetical protein